MYGIKTIRKFCFTICFGKNLSSTGSYTCYFGWPFSSGEITAASIAGQFSWTDALRLINKLCEFHLAHREIIGLTVSNT